MAVKVKAGGGGHHRASEERASATPARTPDNESPAARKSGWLDDLKVHPAAELLPRMEPAELWELAEDIKKNRLQSRIKVLKAEYGGTRQYFVIDGRNRLDAIEWAMGPIKVFEAPGSIPNQRFFECVEDIGDPYDYVMSMNLRRRHLTGEQKREVVAKWLKAKPEQSDRQVAKTVGVHHGTVGSVRTELEGRGEISHVETRTDTKGRQQKAHKPSVKLPENVDLKYRRAERKFSGDFEWYTPKEYIEAARSVFGAIDLDPATSAVAQKIVKAKRYYTIDDDGLDDDWDGHVWLNPPYAQMAQWVDKLLVEYRAEKVSAAILLSSNGTDTEWFHQAAAVATAICFTKGRIKFVDGNGAGDRSSPPTGSAFLYFGTEIERFHKVFGKFGTVVVSWHALKP
jgi:phage N-6-adenine-methyltransferase